MTFEELEDTVVFSALTDVEFDVAVSLVLASDVVAVVVIFDDAASVRAVVFDSVIFVNV